MIIINADFFFKQNKLLELVSKGYVSLLIVEWID